MNIGRHSSFLIWDIFFVVLVALYALAANLGIADISAQGSVIDSDLATYAQGMAGAKHLELFVHDPVLHNITPANSIWNIQRFFAESFTDPENPAMGLLHIGSVIIFIWFVGFYILGRFIFVKPTFAILTSIFMGITVFIEWGTFWGVLHSDPVPRVMYGAIWPFLLIGCLLAVDRPMLRPFVMFITGLSMWIHGINALNCGAMFFLAFLFYRPDEFSWLKHCIFSLVCLIIYLIPVLTFLWSSMSPKDFSIEDLALFREIFDMRWNEDYGNLISRIWNLFNPYSEFSILWILVSGFISWLIVLYKGKGTIHKLAKLYPPFILALLIVVCFSAFEGYVSRYYLNRLPMGHELVRGLRYLIPFSWLMVTGMFATLCPQKFLRVFSSLVFLFAVILFCVSQDRQNMAVHHTISQYTGIFMPLEKKAIDEKYKALVVRDEINAIIENIPEGEAVFSDHEDMFVRYMALHPLVYSFKDGYAHYYSRDIIQGKLWLNYARKMEMAKLENPEQIVDIWLESKAQWFLFHNASLLPSVIKNGTIVKQGDGWFIAKRNT